MIDYLHGKLALKEPTHVVIDVNGIGFGIDIPMSTYDRLPTAGSPVQLHTYLNVRDDGMQLFGFMSSEERGLFSLLIQVVSGVGPKLALNVLSTMSVGTFCQAVVDGDMRTLGRISGIGKRSAERIIVELRNRVQAIRPTMESAGSTFSAIAEDAANALQTLGFKAEIARKVVSELAQDETERDTQQLIKDALKQLNR